MIEFSKIRKSIQTIWFSCAHAFTFTNLTCAAHPCLHFCFDPQNELKVGCSIGMGSHSLGLDDHLSKIHVFTKS